MQTSSNILLAHAFFLENDEKQLKDKYRPYPPLATLYAAAVLREAGYSVSLFDAVLADSIAQFSELLASERFDLIVIYEDDFNFLTKMCLTHVRQACLEMTRLAVHAGVPVIVHSADASDNPELYLRGGAAHVIAGEGEQTLLELVTTMGPTDAPTPPGLFTLQEGQVVSSGRRRNLRDISHLPTPAWELVDFSRYREAWLSRHGYFSVNLVSSRGCPYRCNWCAKPIWGQQYVRVPPQRLADQVAWLKQHARADHIWYADDIFGLNVDWLSRFTASVEALDARIPFTIQSRADLIDQETADLLGRAGCQEVWLGVESGSQAILDAMDKDLQLSQVREARRRLAARRIKVGFFIQLGYTGEDLSDLEKTRQMILELRPDSIGVSVSYPLPGTLFHEQVKQHLRDKKYWQDSNDLDAFSCARFSSGFYRMVRDHLHAELSAIQSGEDTRRWQEEWCRLLEESVKHLSSDLIPTAEAEAEAEA